MNLEELKSQLTTRANPVIVEFWAPWCIPCRVTKPMMESLAKEYEGKVDFWAINADEHSQLLRELKIFGIPTVLITRNGEILTRYTGAQSRDRYRIMFEALAQARATAAVSMSGFDRFLRLFVGTLIAFIGFSTSTWLLIPIGGAIAFLGIYDRCPVWRAIATYFNKSTP